MDPRLESPANYELIPQTARHWRASGGVSQEPGGMEGTMGAGDFAPVTSLTARNTKYNRCHLLPEFSMELNMQFTMELNRECNRVFNMK